MNDGDDDDVGFPESSPSSSSSSSSLADAADSYLVGFVLANIVGIRHYTGTVSGRELVGLVREPLNTFDPNAIKVLNTRSVQVGHIERTVAAVLAPLLDSRVVAAEGIVPKPPKSSNSFRLPCQIHLFARLDAFEVVRAAVAEGGMQLIDVSDPEFGLSEAAVVKERGGKSARKVDEIFALVGRDEGKITPAEPPKEVILSELFDHQKEGLGWLVGRENSCELPPFWEEKDGGFVNVLTNYKTHERPNPLRGGIFADDMGLGKTLTLLSLIATSSRCTVRPYAKEISGGSVEGNMRSRSATTSRSSKKVGNSQKRLKLDVDSGESEDASGSKTTLIVCPPSVISSWITQLEEHTRPGSLKVYLYHGVRTRDEEELMKYDIVFTTYSTLSADFGYTYPPIQKIKWYRVILDEAHVIKNFAARQTKAVIALKAERRWVVTGTPIQNSSFDLFPHMAFLRFEPFSIKSYWLSLVQRPLDQGTKSGLSRLQALLGAISLRRTKTAQNGKSNLVALPPKIVETYFVNLSAEERERYDVMESEAQNTVREYMNADTVLHNYSTVLHIILRLRQICNDVALCPSDITSLLPSNHLEDVSKNPELLKKLASLVEDGDDFDCPVCLSPPAKTVITCCAHIFCQNCILRTLKRHNACCPICRHLLSKSDLFLAPEMQSSDDDECKSLLSNRPISSKVSTLLKLLLASKKQDPSTKSVVFSQFKKMLILLEPPLKDAGFSILRLDGSMSMKKRFEVINEFSRVGPDAPTVLLGSLRAAGAGINLTAASRVYLLEPWWNPGVEEQAMDRVYRIGQQKEVKVVRLIVSGSIEERILELQERKKRLATGAFGRKAAKEQKQMRVEDLRIMMRL